MREPRIPALGAACAVVSDDRAPAILMPWKFAKVMTDCMSANTPSRGNGSDYLGKCLAIFSDARQHRGRGVLHQSLDGPIFGPASAPMPQPGPHLESQRSGRQRPLAVRTHYRALTIEVTK